jgi:hypothetical protein
MKIHRNLLYHLGYLDDRHVTRWSMSVLRYYYDPVFLFISMLSKHSELCIMEPGKLVHAVHSQFYTGDLLTKLFF